MLPHHCLLCGARAERTDLCTGCRADLPWIAAVCRRCARPLPPGPPVCGPCLRRPPPQAATVAPLRYAFPADQLLLKLKFADSLPPGRVLGELLGAYLLERGATADVVMPVPLHPRRQRERGYNQALELARPVARALDIPLLTRACRRTHYTPAQSTLTAAERRRNLRRAFVADAARVEGLTVALVDDVYTTGSTIAAAARALHAAGAARVFAWCVARA